MKLLRCNVLNSCRFSRTLKFVIACMAILAASQLVAGQRGGGGGGHQSSSDSEYQYELGQGVQAYKSGQYDEAITRFQKAVQLQPNLPLPKAYLGVALGKKVVPGSDSPENLQIAQQAIRSFQDILKINPYDVNSMKQIAGIEFNIKKLDEARDWQKRVLSVSPKDPGSAYVIGVIDWMQAHLNALSTLKQAGLTDDQMGNAKAPAGVMATIKTQNSALVEEALLYLNQAVENRPGFDDAMLYLNLVYRRKADVDFGNEAARLDDLAKARQWRSKAYLEHMAHEAKKPAAPEAPKP